MGNKSCACGILYFNGQRTKRGKEDCARREVKGGGGEGRHGGQTLQKGDTQGGVLRNLRYGLLKLLDVLVGLADSLLEG